MFLHRAAGTAIRQRRQRRPGLAAGRAGRPPADPRLVGGRCARLHRGLPRSGILDLPTGSALGFSVLLRLVALLLGRLTDLGGVTSAAVALGLLEQGIAWDHDPSIIDPVLGLVVIAALVWRRREVGVIDPGDASARGRPTRCARSRPGWPRPAAPGWRAGARWPRSGRSRWRARRPATDQQFKAAMLVYAVLGLSLVLLSGWGGIVSLGQIAFFATGRR